MGIDLDAIVTFGEIDADADPLLAQAFEDHDVYIKVRSHEKYVVLGRKGSGKTAIYKKIVGLNQDNVFSIGHTFSDYPWHHHAKQKEVGVPEEFCYRQSWEYLINITLAKILLSLDATQPWSDQALSEMATLETFVTDTYGSTTPDLGTIFSPTRKLKLRGELAINWSVVNAKIGAEAVPIEYLPLIVQEVNRTLLYSIRACLNPDIDYFVCFDELDLGFSLDAADYKHRLIGLLLAARRINNMALEGGKQLSVVIFLRDDIYEMLHFEDKNKITDLASAQIEWDVGSNSPSLKALMERRFHVVLGIPQTGAWNQVFDETQRMTGKQSKYDHILDRTFYRPRDIIRFCNDILTAHRANNVTQSQIFSNKDIIESRRSYSEYLLRELDDEIAKHAIAHLG